MLINHGVRGSSPSANKNFDSFGGNTICVELKTSVAQIIFDCGTGFSKVKFEKDIPSIILFSHFHHDHIQGFPFFTPIYQPDRPVYMFPTLHKKNVVLSSLIDQMDGAHFPITPDQVPSNFNFITEDPLGVLAHNGFKISLIPMNHPGGAYGYKIIINDKSICYFTDNEIDPPYNKSINHKELVSECKNVDVLIHDAQYTEEDMPLKHGWGHSLISQVSELGNLANVKQLVYFHHDPERSDEELDQQQTLSNQFFEDNNPNIKPNFAYEGMKIIL